MRKKGITLYKRRFRLIQNINFISTEKENFEWDIYVKEIDKMEGKSCYFSLRTRGEGDADRVRSEKICKLT